MSWVGEERVQCETSEGGADLLKFIPDDEEKLPSRIKEIGDRLEAALAAAWNPQQQRRGTRSSSGVEPAAAAADWDQLHEADAGVAHESPGRECGDDCQRFGGAPE